ncbi:chorismate mutase [Caldalkalibacillus uzonensis]|uniref:UPF0735 ACT domain-containing protein J2S00_002296 n=1 Tax=Caldalkalibacillus uzonensis TaxID=353224 RepID=A0ABU0CSV1_9BACI|nr:ACT domain-containing protein [Caldalkalibacillus uzonensis]MDQ0339508.1 chorismate mutase [Caldalkalibacillus uzonensis]
MPVHKIRDKDTFYLIRADILPESMQKTIEAKKLLETGVVHSVQEAVDRVNLSRSAFYKYKDAIFPFNAAMKQKIMTISVNLEHRTGVLSRMLSYIAQNRGNILTINQSIPLQGLANVILSVETAQMDMDATQLAEGLKALDGVQKVMIIGQET